MADLAATDVTVTLLNQRKLSDSRNLNRVRLAFGDGALTYPAGGVPLTKGKLGCPTIIESMVVVDKGTSGYSFMYDQSAVKLVMFHEGSHTHDVKLIGGLTLDAAVGMNSTTFGKNTATNATIAGANSTTLGGVVATTPGALAEPSAVAIAAQTIEVEVIGW